MIDKISIIMTFHNEGLLANYALTGMSRLRKMSDLAGLSTELICVLDNIDADTRDIVINHSCMRSADIVEEVANGDLAASRNSGTARASGDFIAIVDGDDYYSDDWFIKAHMEMTKNRQAKLICHPEWVVSFGESHSLYKVLDQRNTEYPLPSLLKHHPWISCSFGVRETYEKFPYRLVYHGRTGFAYEDWHWNLELLSYGYMHITAADTALYYRRKKNSMLVTHNSSRGIIRPTHFFDRVDLWPKKFHIYE